MVSTIRWNRQEFNVWNSLRERLRTHTIFYSLLRAVYRFFLPAPEQVITKCIEDAFRSQESIFFLQVGTSDGVTDDPLHPLLKRKKKWNGIFVEPIGYIFEKLKKTYPHSDRFIFENVAISEMPGRRKFYCVSEKARDETGKDLPFYYHQLGSFDINHVLKHIDDRIAQYVIDVDVECIPLGMLVERHRVTAIDLILIDAEGYDYKVLAQIDFKKFRPKVIIFEHAHLPDKEKIRARELLMKYDYELIEIKKDTMGIRKENR